MQNARASKRVALVGVVNPFPGLRPFESSEELIFRGRQQHTGTKSCAVWRNIDFWPSSEAQAVARAHS
jgi:hypothetical protein